MTNSTFSGNTGGDGGAIYSSNSLTVTSSTFTGNSATVDGGAIYNAGTMGVTGSTFTGNNALAGADGGAIAAFSRRPSRVRPSAATPAAGGNGGGIFNDATMTISGSVISGNSAGPSGGSGGGIYDNDTLTMTDSTISGNTASGGGNGAGLYEDSDNTAVSRSTFSGNTTNGSGGGIYIDGDNVTLTNVTISGNTAASGGGLFSDGDGLVIVASTIADNTGAGIANDGSVEPTGTIIANNDVNCNLLAPMADGGSNLQFPGTTCGASITSADPMLQPLANNGGLTQTQALVAGSPALDTNTEDCPPPSTDQRGIARPQGPPATSARSSSKLAGRLRRRHRHRRPT